MWEGNNEAWLNFGSHATASRKKKTKQESLQVQHHSMRKALLITPSLQMKTGIWREKVKQREKWLFAAGPLDSF
jgi:hypothetical protein